MSITEFKLWRFHMVWLTGPEAEGALHNPERGDTNITSYLKLEVILC